MPGWRGSGPHNLLYPNIASSDIAKNVFLYGFDMFSTYSCNYVRGGPLDFTQNPT
jgi:hypothetical protein